MNAWWNAEINSLTDRVMGWYGFTEMSDYRLIPIAMAVAIELDDMGCSAKTATVSDIQAADKATGGHVLATWNAIHSQRAEP